MSREGLVTVHGLALAGVPGELRGVGGRASQPPDFSGNQHKTWAKATFGATPCGR